MARLLYLTSPLMYGSDVQDLQKILNGLSYNCGRVDSYFGSDTEKQVKLFQGAYGLAVDGQVGPYTWNKLKTEVQKIQNKLNELGYNCGYASGYFESSTLSAVKTFQASKNLTVDGVVGTATRSKLFSSTIIPPIVTKNYYASRNNSEINELNPKMQQIVRDFLAKCLKEGIDILITSAYRSLEEQAELYNSGITPARPGDSYHNYSLAIDIVPVDKNGACLWEASSAFKRAGELGESVGLEWGGRWASKDSVHLQKTFGLTIADLKAGKRP